MAITAALLKNLINDAQIVISPYDGGSLKGNMYELHTDGNIRMYDDKYGHNTTLDSEGAVDGEETIAIPGNGYVIEPNRIYYMKMKERIKCPEYDIELKPCKELGEYGLVISVDNSAGFSELTDVTISLTTAHPMLLYPNQAICQAYFNEGDVGTSAVPIGGIIGWRGGKIPYGYTICDGSNGSPNLVDMFIMGGEVTAPQPPILASPGTVRHYKLMFIMRYK